MIDYIEGNVVEAKEGYVVVDKGGIGFRIITPSKVEGSRVKLFVKLFIKDDEPVLYGFKTREEREIFVKLLSISGIGTKNAVSILKGISPEEFLRLIEEGDYTGFTAVPGIGKKTAQRIVLELKGKLETERDGLAEELSSALTNLGFDKSEIAGVVREVAGRTDSVEEALKLALQKLSEKG
ncbi:MAG: Holliday junction branch migration protein RuvA [Aquificae bacterium]|nr:Holliday junction branch migration protein RuvA [Aquificota bacterium]